MNVLASLRYLATRFFRRSAVAAEMDDELRAHITLRADDLERSGLSRPEAERPARIEFGGRERYRKPDSKLSAVRSSTRSFPFCAIPFAYCARVRDSRLLLSPHSLWLSAPTRLFSRS